MAQLPGPRADVGLVSRVGQDTLSDAFVAKAAADGLNVAGIMREPVHTVGLYLIELDGVARCFHFWRSTSAARMLTAGRL
jgi:2-dehydro-3-deoxygluconokinase